MSTPLPAVDVPAIEAVPDAGGGGVETVTSAPDTTFVDNTDPANPVLDTDAFPAAPGVEQLLLLFGASGTALTFAVDQTVNIAAFGDATSWGSATTGSFTITETGLYMFAAPLFLLRNLTAGNIVRPALSLVQDSVPIAATQWRVGGLTAVVGNATAVTWVATFPIADTAVDAFGARLVAAINSAITIVANVTQTGADASYAVTQQIGMTRRLIAT